MALNNKSNSEPFTPRLVIKAMMIAKSLLLMKKISETWYFDSYASRHLCNDKNLFKNLQLMCIDFVIATGQVIQIEQVKMVLILFKGGKIIL